MALHPPAEFLPFRQSINIPQLLLRKNGRPLITGEVGIVYRGYVDSAAPSVSGGKESIQVECAGYFDWFKRIIVHDSGNEKVYLNQDSNQIVNDILDNFIIPNTSITKGTINATAFQADKLSFKASADQVIKTLAEFVGAVELGVDQNLVFFFINQGASVTDRFYIGDKVAKLSDRIDFKGIINQIFFEGGKVGGVAYKKTGGSTSSQTRYGKREALVSNGAITTDATADQYISGLLTEKSKPIRQLGVSVINLDRRIERNRPMGEIRVRDRETAQLPGIYGTTANGGSNLKYGTIANGGSGAFYGGISKYQVDRVTYTLSPQNGRVHGDIQFGDSLAVSKASATLKQIQVHLDAVRQRSL